MHIYKHINICITHPQQYTTTTTKERQDILEVMAMFGAYVPGRLACVQIHPTYTLDM